MSRRQELINQIEKLQNELDEIEPEVLLEYEFNKSSYRVAIKDAYITLDWRIDLDEWEELHELDLSGHSSYDNAIIGLLDKFGVLK